jgi:hypothetical protein
LTPSCLKKFKVQSLGKCPTLQVGRRAVNEGDDGKPVPVFFSFRFPDKKKNFRAIFRAGMA